MSRELSGEGHPNHKKRLRLRQKHRKKININDILAKISSSCCQETGFSEIFKPMTIVEEDVKLFWSGISEDCTPHKSRLSSEIIDQHMLGVEESRQNKLIKKLNRQVELGIIDIDEKNKRLARFGRTKQKDNVEADGDFTLLNEDRGLRKRQQVDNIATLLKLHNIDQKKVVVDFGSGSGNLCLALASVYPATQFVFVDQNSKSLDILKKRAEAGKLTNIHIKQFQFKRNNLEDFLDGLHQEVGAMDLGIGLHSCGSFTDLIMDLCRIAACHCLVVPCCNGKIDFSGSSYPRSRMVSSLVSSGEYEMLSRTADDLSCYDAKIAVELDRASWSSENGAKVECWRMEPMAATPKHLMIYCAFPTFSDQPLS